MRRRRLAAFALIGLSLTEPAIAAEATCRDYTQAEAGNRALFNGFIFGFMAARLEGKPPEEVNAATVKVQQLADAFCATHPDERAIDVLGGFGNVVSGHVAPQ